MRIFYATESTPNTGFDSNLWRINLYQPLVDLGHDVIEFQYDLKDTFRYVDTQDPLHQKFIKKNRPVVTQALLAQLKKAHQEKPVDLFFTYFYDACILPEALDEIKSWGIKTVNWYCNGSYQIHLVSEISPHYDFCLVPEKFRMDDYKKMGAHPLYSQEAANPHYYKPYDLPKEYEVSFVGQAYGDRMDYIEYLVSQALPVKVWGWGWNRYKKQNGWERFKVTQTVKDLWTRPRYEFAPAMIGAPLSDIEMIKMYSRSKINLGFSSCGETHLKEKIMQIRLRDFEVPMSGGFYMVEYMQELEEFFEIGKEIVCYQNKEDLAQKIKYYLKNDAEREKIRVAGYRRAQKDHTWHKRFEVAFQKMGMPA